MTSNVYEESRICLSCNSYLEDNIYWETNYQINDRNDIND